MLANQLHEFLLFRQPGRLEQTLVQVEVVNAFEIESEADEIPLVGGRHQAAQGELAICEAI